MKRYPRTWRLGATDGTDQEALIRLGALLFLEHEFFRTILQAIWLFTDPIQTVSLYVDERNRDSLL